MSHTHGLSADAVRALSLAWVCSAAPAVTAQDRPTGPLQEAIVYTTLRPPNSDVYLFEEPGGAPRRLTDHPALDYNAVFSPDGRWVVFTSERNGNADLFALDLLEGGQPVPLTRDLAFDDAAAFAPDGTRLAFVSTREGNADVFVMPFAPGDATAEASARNLTDAPGGDFHPAFSPDGERIAFARQGRLFSSEPANGAPMLFDISLVDLWVMRSDGSEARQVSTRVPGPEMEPGVAYGSVAGSPVWSADGDHLYYYRMSAEGGGIRRMRPDGTEDEHVVSDGLSPAVAPEGRIAFSRPQPRAGMDAGEALRTGRILSVAADGSEPFEESGDERSYFAPHVDLGTGRLVAHGPAPTDGLPGDLGGGELFAPPGARVSARLGDHTVEVWGVRGFFPALTDDGDILSTILEAAPALGLSRSSLDGARRTAAFVPEAGIAWGAAVARDAGWLVVAVGPLFAPGSEHVDLWRVELDGSGAENLTAEQAGNDALPHVTPDGLRIAYRRGGDGGGRVYTMNPFGEEKQRLTDEEAIETMPTLSSDGEWVVFSTDLAAGRKLWIQRVDGSEGRFLEPDRLEIPDTSMHARFSPDDRWVVFTSDRGGYNDEWPLTPWPQPYGELYAVPVAGGAAVRLTHDKWEDGPCDWASARLPERK